MNGRRKQMLALLGFAVVLSPMTPASAGVEIVIEATALRPAVLETTVEQRVTFVNRTGWLVHLEFRPARDRHEIFQVPGRIWATFHVPGRHPYVVHIEEEGWRVRALEGAVLVRADPNGSGAVPVCNGMTVSSENGEVCIER